MTRDEAEAIRARCCAGKARYASPGHARRDAFAVMAHNGDGRPVRSYRCPFCHNWHVGHVPDLEGLAALATAIRVLSGNLEATPCPPQPTS